jgi:DNA-binding NarL/FixJ family response regulator
MRHDLSPLVRSSTLGPAPAERPRVLCLVDRADAAGRYELALRRAGDLACAGTLSAIDELEPALEREAPAAVLVDLAGPHAPAFRRIAELRARRPQVAFVVVHASEDAALVRAARECGARGFAVDCLGPEAALASVRAVLADLAAPRAWSSPRGIC